MNKLFPIWLLLSFSTMASAANPAAVNQAELANAQMQYQALVKAQTEDQTEMIRLQNRLYSAEKRLIDAQIEVNSIRTELARLQNIHQHNVGALKTAGDRLDKAWRAVYGR